MLEFIFVIVSLTAEDERISLLQPNVDLNNMLTSMQNILNSGGLDVERVLLTDVLNIRFEASCLLVTL